MIVAFTPVEIIALILIVISAIKMLVLVSKPMAWMDFAKGIYKKPAVTKFIGAVLAGVILYYLIDSGVTIVQILAVSLFMAMLFMIGLSEDVKPFIKKYEAQIKAGKMWKKHWFYTLIWLALLVWGALVLFNVI
jgi:hypothetical protein